MRAMCRSWGRAPMRPGSARPCSTARAPSRAWRRISTGTAPGSTSPPINFKLKPVVDTETWLGLAREGIARFDANAELYIRPMYWAAERQRRRRAVRSRNHQLVPVHLCRADAGADRQRDHAVAVPPADHGMRAGRCQGGCLYPNNSRALIEAQSRGFNNCLMLDMLGNVAEFGNSNVFMAKDGVVYTPAPNGTFLNGITRQRVIDLLRGDGVTVVEATLRYADFLDADEIFSSGNFAKVAPVDPDRRRALQPGPFYRRARKLVLGLRPRLRRSCRRKRLRSPAAARARGCRDSVGRRQDARPDRS